MATTPPPAGPGAIPPPLPPPTPPTPPVTPTQAVLAHSTQLPTSSRTYGCVTQVAPTTTPWYRRFWDYITGEGAQKSALLFAVLILIGGGILTWYYWEEIIAFRPTLAAFSTRLLWLVIGALIGCLLLWKKTRRFFWTILFYLAAGWLVIWVIISLLKWAFIPTGKIFSMRDVVENPITAFVGDMSEAQNPNTDVQPPPPQATTADCPPAPPATTQTFYSPVPGREAYLTLKKDGMLSFRTLWRMDSGKPGEVARYKVDSPSGMVDATTEEVAAILINATKAEDKGPVAGLRPVGEVYRDYRTNNQASGMTARSVTTSSLSAAPAMDIPEDRLGAALFPPNLLPSQDAGVQPPDDILLDAPEPPDPPRTKIKGNVARK